MKINYWAKMLNPEVVIVVCKEGQAVGKLRAKNANDSKYANEEIKDFTMHSFKPMAKVEIR